MTTTTSTGGRSSVVVSDGEPAAVPAGLDVTFAAGLPGFPQNRTFRVEPLGDGLEPFLRLRSLSGPDVGFTVVSPGRLFPDYTIEIDDDHQAVLGIGDPADVMALVMITVPRPPLPPTANLLGPIVVNRRTGVAAQVVQHRSGHKVAELLPGAEG